MSYKVILSCLKCSLLVIFLLLFQPSFSQQNWEDLSAELEAKKKLMGNDIVMMLANKDTIIYKKEINKLFNSKTQAPIASSSKWLTAALVMIFVDEGKVSLDDKIGQWIPELDRYGKSYITLRYCLAHMTGIKDDRTIKSIIERRKFSSLEEEANSFAAREIRANPSQDFWYGNIGPNLAGRVIEVISKKRFDVVIKQKLFNPLEMRRTTFTSMDGSATNPAGGAQSTAEDYMKFLMMLLNKGKYKGKQILSEESVNMLMQVQTKPEIMKFVPEAAKGYNYTLGSWAVEDPLLTSPTAGGEGTASVLACPGLFGAWPMVDFCRGYAYLFFVKTLLSEERAEEHKKLKAIVDEQMPSTCN